MTARVALGLVFLGLLATRLCHLQIVWPEETLPMAAAVQMLHGKALYRDIWYDKPPLVSAVYLLWGAYPGWPLRLAGAAYVLLACWLVYRFGRDVWSEREGVIAGAFLAFFLTFGIPASVMALAADLLMVAPHIAAVWLAWRGHAFWSGALAGIAFLCNSKALFVLAACAVFQFRAWAPLGAGFLVPNAIALGWLAWSGALAAYWQQVWEWGMLYSRNTFVDRPIPEGLKRTANWTGFQAALVIGAAVYWWRQRDATSRRFAVWAVLSLIAVAAGWRFFPRYYFQLLPVFALVAARGFYLMSPRPRVVVALALVIPFARFGPRYGMLAADLLAGREHNWGDVAMDQDSREASALVNGMARPGETLFVWGYRPEIYVYTRLPAGTRFLESQPLSGVFADRHLFQSDVVAPDLARAHRAELTASEPTYVLDGLGPYNPALAISAYPDLSAWLARYQPVAESGRTRIYRLISPSNTARASPETR